MTDRRAMEVEGFTCVVRDFDPRGDTPMLMHTMLMDHKRVLSDKVKNSEGYLSFARARFGDILKNAHKVKVLCVEGTEETILGFAVFPFQASEKPYASWVNRKLGEHREAALVLLEGLGSQ